MSDTTGAKRLRAEARSTCAKLEEAARKILLFTAGGEKGGMVLIPVAEFETLAHALAHQGGRLDMAVSMAETRRKRK